MRFAYFLAERFGTLYVNDVLNLPAKVFRQWERYYEVVPPDTVKDDWRFASVRHMLHLVNRSSKQKAIDLKDFVLKWEAEEPKPHGRTQTLEQQWAILNILAAMHANDASPVPKIIITDAPTEIDPAASDLKARMEAAKAEGARVNENDGPGQVDLPPGFQLPPDVQAQVDAAMKKS